MSLERMLTIEELAEETGLGQGEIRAAIAEGDLPFVQRKPRTRIRIKESDFVAWQERHTRKPVGDVKPQFTAPEKVSASPRSIDHLFSPSYQRRFSKAS